MKTSVSINPATEEQIAEYNRLTKSETHTKINSAHAAYLQWKTTSYQERAKLLNALADVFETHKDKYALLATSEMGKTLDQAVKEVEKCALICRYYAEHGANLLQNVTVDTEAQQSYVTFQPLGVILAVMPWNFPFYQAIRFLGPAVMAGNTAVLKHASNVQGCAFAIEEAVKQAGFPEGIFTNLNLDSDAIESVIAHENIVAVTLTGSAPAGKSVAAIAGKHLKKSVLELGGNDAYIVLEDANLDKATDLATQGRIQNNGQTCIAAKRFIVLESIYEAFIKLYTEKMGAAKMGDPTDKDTVYGPLARIDLRNELHEQVKKTIAQGGTLLLGGHIPDRKGAYYPATILTDLKPGMEAFNEELFGPVASVIRAKNETEAIALANMSKFGLGAGVITSDAKKGETIALQLEAGNCFVNKLVASDPRLPFGGIKTSGYGRELSEYGIKEFVNIKTVWIN
ncbi:NAD-dependent succinate-semialdehyde dehydrogenase [Formosa sediminum]|uniref:NAD-dependent succinate-semialdehyde dehydrogenase n=1 Tax=Formosa sediminum TaxID=2594004 RepID=A0A516GTQ8_9FLAO|nr:NAD-dependent succinate-semialdehyde dehydrogenase [Formosa sediminum]QDO94914.1 NAD-dependent succinate-semialdehyde dehydrogenase [Formosa sediminum]